MKYPWVRGKHASTLQPLLRTVVCRWRRHGDWHSNDNWTLANNNVRWTQPTRPLCRKWVFVLIWKSWSFTETLLLEVRWGRDHRKKFNTTQVTLTASEGGGHSFPQWNTDMKWPAGLGDASFITNHKWVEEATSFQWKETHDFF